MARFPQSGNDDPNVRRSASRICERVRGGREPRDCETAIVRRIQRSFDQRHVNAKFFSFDSLKGAVELPSIDVHSLVQSMNLLTLFTPTRHRKIPKSDLPALKYVRWIQLDSNSGSPGVEDDATRHTSVRKGFHVDGMYGRKFREAFGGIGPTPEMYPWLYFRRIANQSAQDSILIMVKHRKTCSILDGGPADFPYRGKTISILPMPQDVGKSRTLELVGIR